MSRLPATVADIYRYVVGVHTHAATHSYAIVAALSGALLDQSSFPARVHADRCSRPLMPRDVCRTPTPTLR
mgnify:FL=1